MRFLCICLVVKNFYFILRLCCQNSLYFRHGLEALLSAPLGLSWEVHPGLKYINTPGPYLKVPQICIEARILSGKALKKITPERRLKWP